MPTSTVEDYLKCLDRLESNQKSDKTSGPSVGVVADELGVTTGTVSVMMRNLQKKGWVDYQPRRSVALTEQGRAQARDVLRRHRVIETFLVKVMGFSGDAVHEEAEVLEHAVSERVMERMDEMLDFPEFDPHGSPIPKSIGE